MHRRGHGVDPGTLIVRRPARSLSPLAAAVVRSCPPPDIPNRPDDVGGIECGGHWTRTPWPPAVAAPSTIPSRPPPRSRSSAVPARRPRPRSSESRRFTPPVLPHPHRRRTTASSPGTCPSGARRTRTATKPLHHRTAQRPRHGGRQEEARKSQARKRRSFTGRRQHSILGS